MTAAQRNWHMIGRDHLRLDPIEGAVAAIAAGPLVVVVSTESRRTEGSLVVAAEKATAEITAIMLAECRGPICVSMREPDLERLDLPVLAEADTEPRRTTPWVSVNASILHGAGVGFSAPDRATTIRLLAELTATPT
jgi:3,4-dihydroxy 2-butanone 4-phosphate synthase / GTP cyclohydrolase II